MGNFKPWITSVVAGTNIQDAETFAEDSQRENGFQLGVIASSVRVNSALRQANLVSAAFMEAILPDSDLSLTSSFTDVVAAIRQSVVTTEIPPGIGSTDSIMFGSFYNSEGTGTTTKYAKLNETLSTKVISSIMNIGVNSATSMSHTSSDKNSFLSTYYIYEIMNGKKRIDMTESEYEALTTKDANMVYYLTED